MAAISLRVGRVSNLAFCCSQLLPVCAFNFKWRSDNLFLIVLSNASVKLTSILVPSYTLRVRALISFGCRATVESLSSVHSSSKVAELPHWMPIAHAMLAKFKAFSFPVIKSYSDVPVFHSSIIQCFPVSPLEHTSKSITFMEAYPQTPHIIYIMGPIFWVCPEPFQSSQRPWSQEIIVQTRLS